MAEILTAAEMRSLEKVAMESGRVTGLELMERAGQGVCDALFAQWPALRWGPHRAVVLCGPGNNGGDGFVIARVLAERGWLVEVCLLGDPTSLPRDAQANHDRWCAAGHAVVPLGPGCITGAVDLLVDALFGTGLTRPVTLDLAGLMTAEAEIGHRVAVDIPSGLCADSGRILGAALAADLTVSFQTAKRGHYLADAGEVCGALRVVDIGLGPWLDDRAAVAPAQLIGLPLEALAKRRGHKFSHGHALVLTGGAGRTGAARLAARGALRVGAGLVTLGVPPAAQMEVAQQITALMLRRISDASDLSAVLRDSRITAVCLGPGLGLDEGAAEKIAAVLASGKPVVLDADACTLIGQDPALFDALHGGCVLTPHGGEFARLFPDVAARLEAKPDRGPAFSKIDAAMQAADRAGCCVVFKGPDTVVAGADGSCRVNPPEAATAWLATAGSGDVLAGFVTGLLARGLAPVEAAAAAVALHAGCARRFGPGLIAEDLPETLPAVFRDLGL
ncbi:NAD(P)H-hydrate dehydratase [Roseobacter sinensis]|uniref:Bifunctional NAD(P)H-hydrate repair enzyme n=1 Tax=Roseobacter sinensis TaxID=2931391 RepID=A0ABT3BDD0_9RHOB|nr:NAD(P)H-hydrate dehydratase [Roseobacter sp. WL0113]MCV3271163.1 NAD(P)H-hydrate dehydratase [Roseobacter sp. WL0113]